MEQWIGAGCGARARRRRVRGVAGRAEVGV